MVFLCQISVLRVLDRLHPRPNKDRATKPPPETPGNKGWLVSAEQQLLCQFKADSATVYAQWVAVLSYSWFYHVNQCRKPAGGCFGTKPSRRGTRF